MGTLKTRFFVFVSRPPMWLCLLSSADFVELFLDDGHFVFTQSISKQSALLAGLGTSLDAVRLVFSQT
jgi:hypothetical protein